MGTHPIFESDFDCLTEMIRLCVSRRLSLCSVRAGKTDPTDIMQSWFKTPERERKPATFNSEFSIYQEALSRELEEDAGRERAERSPRIDFKMSMEDQEIIKERRLLDSKLLKNIVAKEKTAFKTTEERRALKSELTQYSLPTFEDGKRKGFLKSDDGRTVVYAAAAKVGNMFEQQIYTSCGCGVYWGPGHVSNYRTPVNRTNRWTMKWTELYAIDIALREAKRKKIDFLEVRTDSKLCVDAFEKNIRKWQERANETATNQWTHSNGQLVKEQSFLTKLMKIKDDLNVYFVHVPQGSKTEWDCAAVDVGIFEAAAQAKEGANKHWTEYYNDRLAPSFRYRYHYDTEIRDRY